MSATFTARYAGSCGDCDERITVGDEVRYDEDDDLVHVRCRESNPDAAQLDLAAVCPDCWLVHSGECDR